MPRIVAKRPFVPYVLIVPFFSEVPMTNGFIQPMAIVRATK